MQSINSIIKKIRVDFPAITLIKGEVFSWSPNNKTVFYEGNGDPRLLIHELSHAILNHSDYKSDIELMRIEVDTWEKTKELADKYQIDISEDFIQTHLDTYRDWLHKRSICPECGSNGVQIKKTTYSCVVCGSQWIVNESKINNLRRYKTNKKTQ